MTACLLLLPLIARAGSYSDPTYSGGTVTIAYPSGPASFNYSLNSQDNTWGGRYYASGYADSSISVTCSDPIGTTFTWNNGGNSNDLPPQCVILTEYCQTYWYGSSNNGTVTGGCSNPMGGSAVPYSPPPGSFWEATKYSVINNPPATLSISSSPSATATSAASSFPGTGVASVKYSASASPVTITPGGATTVNGAFEVLTGQQITATLNAPYPVDPNSYVWSATGDVFETYHETAASHQLVLLSDDPSYTNQAAFSFYDKKAETITITCHATLIAPDGTRLPVTAQSPQITVVKPSVTYWGIAEGYVQPGIAEGVPAYGLYPDPSSAYGAGMTWHDVAVSVPAAFPGGQCDFAQLVKPDREEYHGNTASPLNGDPKNGLIGLDGALPYSTGGFGSGWTPPAIGGNGDSPPIQANGNPNNDTQLSANDTFTTWVIYRPPSSGTDTVWIPLQKYSWTWSEQLTWSNNQWNITAAFPKTAGSGPSFTTQQTDDPPQWNLVH